MLVVGGHNAVGNVLHVIIGPETELFTDIHGAKVLDITELLSRMNGEQPVYLSLTRCKSEAFTAASMDATGLAYYNSFTGQPVADQPSHHVATGASQSAPPPIMATPAPKDTRATPQVQQQPVQGVVVQLQRGRCTYCGTPDKALLPLEGICICGECMAIELGRLKEKDGKELDGMSANEQ
jgi:hypothetical protein